MLQPPRKPAKHDSVFIEIPIDSTAYHISAEKYDDRKKRRRQQRVLWTATKRYIFTALCPMDGCVTEYSTSNNCRRCVRDGMPKCPTHKSKVKSSMCSRGYHLKVQS
jgi:hypothetical protein